MSAWTDAITDSRKETAEKWYRRLKEIGWDKLSKNDRTVMLLLGWFCLEEDDSGEPEQHIEHDFREEED